MHYVYYLHDSAGVLMYIGRSIDPEHRRYVFCKRTGIEVTLGLSQRFKDLVDAQEAELAAILRHAPPHNKYLASSPGNFGKKHGPMPEHVKKKIAACQIGRVRSEATRAKLRAARVGQKPPRLGAVLSDETKNKIRASIKATLARKKEMKNERVSK